jgi:hypothetical protein
MTVTALFVPLFPTGRLTDASEFDPHAVPTELIDYELALTGASG